MTMTENRFVRLLALKLTADEVLDSFVAVGNAVIKKEVGAVDQLKLLIEVVEERNKS